MVGCATLQGSSQRRKVLKHKARTMFKGSYTALITPFRNGDVDEDAFTRIIDWQIAEGTHGLVPVGTTGESPTLDFDEHKRVIALSVEAAKKRVPVIAGTGSNSTDEAIELSQYAEKAGADGVLIVTPYYNKPTQEGLYQHFKAINDAINIPIIIYNIPGRSIVDMSVSTMARLSELKNIAGREGCDGKPRAPLPAAPRVRRKVLPALGRGWDGAGLHGARRTGRAFRLPPTSHPASSRKCRTPASRAITKRRS